MDRRTLVLAHLLRRITWFGELSPSPRRPLSHPLAVAGVTRNREHGARRGGGWSRHGSRRRRLGLSRAHSRIIENGLED
eukprot:1910304-Pyramimonas_sp.AAC.1